MVDFFPDVPIANRDERKEQITIRDLLNMSSGLQLDDHADMTESQDWSRFALDRPMASKPGTSFLYDNANPQLLCAILQKVTGMTAEAYAREKLFKPLGIENYYWEADPSGGTQGGFGLMLAPRDMAKLGYLYLHQGQWEGKQIVPAAWIDETKRTNGNAYSYLWWQRMYGTSAIGIYGQIIYVMPEKDLVVVTTAGMSEEDQWYFYDLIDYFIGLAVKSDQALPTSPDSQKLLERVEAIANPAPEPIILPAMVEAVNGKTLVLEANALGWETAKLEFKPDQAWLSVKTEQDAKASKYAIGLDGHYLLTKTTRSTANTDRVLQRYFLNPYEFNFLLGMPVDGAVAMKGKVPSDSKFTIIIQHTQDMDRDEITFTFSPEGAVIIWNSLLNGTEIFRANGKFD